MTIMTSFSGIIADESQKERISPLLMLINSSSWSSLRLVQLQTRFLHDEMIEDRTQLDEYQRNCCEEEDDTEKYDSFQPNTQLLSLALGADQIQLKFLG